MVIVRATTTAILTVVLVTVMIVMMVLLTKGLLLDSRLTDMVHL